MESSTSRSYRSAVEHLESLGIMPLKAPSLEPTLEGLRKIGFGTEFTIDPSRVIVVAGTNGKGTTCATLEALLRSAGRKVGFFSSPHLEETTERFRLSGHDVSQEWFTRVFEYVHARTKGGTFTHFEMLTFMAVAGFCKFDPVDFLVLEVGLGGTWDSTNAIPHKYSVITRLGLDHENILGRGIIEIARNKFGIVSEQGQVIHLPLPEGTLDLKRSTQRETRSEWTETDPFEYEARSGHFPPQFFLNGNRLSIAGRRAAENANLALKTYEMLRKGHPIPPADLTALNRIRWPGRMEGFVRGTHTVFLSGDHNPQGVESLTELLAHYREPSRPVVFLAGVGRDKDYSSVFRLLLSTPNSCLALTETPFKGIALTELPAEITAQAVLLERDPKRALEWIWKHEPLDALVIVTGSLYLVGEVRKLLRAQGFDALN